MKRSDLKPQKQFVSKFSTDEFKPVLAEVNTVCQHNFQAVKQKVIDFINVNFDDETKKQHLATFSQIRTPKALTNIIWQYILVSTGNKKIG